METAAELFYSGGMDTTTAESLKDGNAATSNTSNRDVKPSQVRKNDKDHGKFDPNHHVSSTSTSNASNATAPKYLSKM